MKRNSQKTNKTSLSLALSLCLAGVLSGCSYLDKASNEAKSIAVEPAPNAGFIEQPGPIDLTRLTWYGPAKGIMDMWSKQFVQIANRKPGEVITGPVALTLRPF